MTVHARPLSPEDRSAWNALFRDYLAFYGTALPTASLERSFKKLIDPADADRFGLVAIADNRVAGFVNCILHGHNWHDGEVCYLQDLFVAPAFRGSGIGRHLIEAVYVEADERNTPTVYWMTQRSNARARRIYEKVGSLTEFIKYVRA
ncbi:GNAT family N-acetyltransferase [Roseovarius sp. A46]|uniref:GNAT family N-acetyltransferase n=1 Tax=Roseovarius sp. A46 TaxID=2109331 RepID=UPI0010138570|nr:GNAT family N-acetyltransferase [Roseovarius sp. A46]RXV58472.1 GNAT family N-acetyltransferase [Roseovarius sp. A46]